MHALEVCHNITMAWWSSYRDSAWGFPCLYFYEVVREVDKKVLNFKFPMDDVASLNALKAGEVRMLYITSRAAGRPFVGMNARETDIAGGDDSNAL